MASDFSARARRPAIAPGSALFPSDEIQDKLRKFSDYSAGSRQDVLFSQSTFIDRDSSSQSRKGRCGSLDMGAPPPKRHCGATGGSDRQATGRPGWEGIFETSDAGQIRRASDDPILMRDPLGHQPGNVANSNALGQDNGCRSSAVTVEVLSNIHSIYNRQSSRGNDR
ncbi:MAG: hypothetical protein MMC33_003978 [Icmadophila ericetorum]|nr:hypothetical protein [Icmadophila ericetorum]